MNPFTWLREKIHGVFGGTRADTIPWEGKTCPIKGTIQITPEQSGRYWLSSDKGLYPPLDTGGYLRQKGFAPESQTENVPFTDTQAEVLATGEWGQIHYFKNYGAAAESLYLLNADTATPSNGNTVYEKLSLAAGAGHIPTGQTIMHGPIYAVGTTGTTAWVSVTKWGPVDST